MLKKDAIFWSALGILFAGLALMAITHNQFWMALGIGGYLLRPTLASLGVATRNIDERQMSINYRSGNIAFAVTIIACVAMLAKLELAGNHDFELFAMVIIIGLATKALFNVLLVKNYVETGSRIIIGVGLLLGLFMVLDQGTVGGVLVNAGIGIAIAAVGWLGRRYPLPIGILALVIAGLLITAIVTIGLRNTGMLWSQLLVALIVGGPLITAGVCLMAGSRGPIEAERKE